MKFILLFLGLSLIHSSCEKSSYQLIFPGGNTFSFARLVGTIDHELNDFTLCHWSRTNININKYAGVFSYNTEEDNAILSYILHNKRVEINRHNKFHAIDIDVPDSEWLNFCGTWTVVGDVWQIFVNGKRIGSDNWGSVNGPVQTNGVVILGQEQDIMGGRFSVDQALSGQISEVHLWDYILTPDQIQSVHNCLNSEVGNVISWNRATWALFNGTKVSLVDLPCGREQ